MIKRINTNLLAVASTNVDSFVLTLVDVVTGKIVDRLLHKNCIEPINIVMFENFVVYSAHNRASHRSEIFGLSVYEGDVLEKYDMNPWKGVPESVSKDESLSSFEIKPHKLIVQQRGFFINQRIRTLAVTQTQQGITERAVLVGYENGAVLTMDRRFLDPRRPVGTPSKQEQEEKLIPYFAEMPYLPSKLITYFNQVEYMNSIVSIPTTLESTCLVLVVGVDMFYSRVQPSAGFDLLAEEFNHALLIMLTIGLFVAVVTMSKALRKKRLEAKWQ